uniref:Uncharacterized protein n=1 Tax=Anopheles coluzzii TaxID=1518534 RepID=A0A8W7PNQ3_ANOCL
MYTTQEFGTVRWAVSASFSAICVLPDPGSPASSKIPRAPIPPPVSRSKTGTPKLTLRHRSACLVNISPPVTCGLVSLLAPRLGGPFGLENCGRRFSLRGCSSSCRNSSVSSAPLSISSFFATCMPCFSIVAENGPLQLEYIMRSRIEQLYPGIEYTNTTLSR